MYKLNYFLYLNIGILMQNCWSQNPNSASELHDIPWWQMNILTMGIANNDLRAEVMQERFQKDLWWKKERVILEKVLSQRRDDLDEAFKIRIDSLKKLRDAVVKHYAKFNRTNENIPPCCSRRKWDGFGCALKKNSKTGLTFNSPKEVISEIEKAKTAYNSIMLLYYAFNDGSVFFYPTPIQLSNENLRGEANHKHCLSYSPLERPWYDLKRSPVPRDVVLVSNLPTKEGDLQRDLKNKAIKKVVKSLNTNDRIIILNKDTFKSENDGANVRHVALGVWVGATARNLNRIIYLAKQENYYSNKGPFLFQSAKERIKAAHLAFQNPMKLNIKINREATPVLVQVLSGPNITCMENSLLQQLNMSSLTIITYVINSTVQLNCLNVSGEQIVYINDKDDLEIPENNLYNFFKWQSYNNNSTQDDDIGISLPYFSYYDHGIILTITLPIIIDGEFVGTVGCDMLEMETLTEVTKIEGLQHSYGFLVDNWGRTFSHPLLPLPYCNKRTCSNPINEQITRIEASDKVQPMLQSMVNMESGNKTVEAGIVGSTGHRIGNNHEALPVRVIKSKLAYAWLPLKTMKLSFAIAAAVDNNEVFNVSFGCELRGRCRSYDLPYHRFFDTKSSRNKHCVFPETGTTVTWNKRAIKFAPEIFKEPVKYILSSSSSLPDPVIQAINEGKPYHAYLKNGYKIKENVNVLLMASELWKERPTNCRVGFRYFGSTEGIFVTYPAIALENSYDHRNRPWYRVAMSNRRDRMSVSITLPYLDLFTGSEFVTVATPLQVKVDGLIVPVGVLGGDFSVAYLALKFRERLPQCNGIKISCFLLDTMGYVVLDLNEKKKNKLHILQAFPRIAHVLVDKNILVRTGCHNYEKDAIFQYWEMILPDSETTFSSGSGDSEFVLYKIPYTNVHLVAFKTSPKDSISVNVDLVVCQSVCSKFGEPPCEVVNKNCDKPDQDNSRNFARMPLCFPKNVDFSMHEMKSKPCNLPEHTDTYCFQYNNIRNCKYWNTGCFNETYNN